MFELKRNTATNFGVAVTTIVLMAACSHSAVQTEATDEQPIPVSEFSQPTPEPEALPAAAPAPMPELREAPKKASGFMKKKKKKVRYVKHHAKKKSRRQIVRHEKKQEASIATAQVSEQLPPAPPAPPSEISALPQTPVPPAFDNQMLQSEGGFFSHWGIWIALVGAVGLGLAAAFRSRFMKTTRHRLIFK